MKVYILLIERLIDMEGFAPVIPIVSDNLDEVKKRFREITGNEREIANNIGWEIDTDTDTCFCAYEPQYYNQNHVSVTIFEKELNHYNGQEL